MLKRALPVDLTTVTGPPTKKVRTTPGEISVLTSNACGLDRPTWENIEKMANDNDIDIIAIQEGASKAAVDDLVGSEWESFVQQEKPFAKEIAGTKVMASVGRATFNVVLKRATASDITIQGSEYKPETSSALKSYLIPEPKQEPGKRVRKPVINKDQVNKLGVRGPQKVELTMSGHQSLSIYNNHAPQGSGSAQGYSGMDASTGHEMLKFVLREDTTPFQMVIGDQNAHPMSMQRDYKGFNFDILSATTSPTELCHAAIPRGLNPTPIDLGQDGINFNRKGQIGCSDHPPMAFKFTLPNST